MEAERPLECSSCEKDVSVYYTEVVGDNISRIEMCADCPSLQHKLFGIPSSSDESSNKGIERAGLYCGNCGTSLEGVRMGHVLGCSECYEVFGDVVVKELVEKDKIAPNIKEPHRLKVLHTGRAPGESTEINPSLRLVALNEALEETLSREDYEQAAWLRDQIKEIEDAQKAKK